MATQVQIRRGSTAQNNAFTGVEGEVSFDTQTHRLRTHDGITLGGFELALISDVATKLSLSGGTMSGALDLGGFKITTLGAPTLGGDATNKTYVDAQVSGGAPPFTDTNSLVKGSADATKLLRFEVDGFTAATTRILTPQNSDYIIAGTNISNTFSVAQLLPDGAVGAPALARSAQTTTGIYFSGASKIDFSLAGTNYLALSTGALVSQVSLVFAASANVINFAGDVILARDAANVLALRNGVNAQSFRIYNTFTDASNHEHFRALWSANVMFLTTVKAGSGITRELKIGTEGGVSLSFITNGTDRWSVNSTGHFVAVTDNTYDIGQFGATRPRHIYTAGDVIAGLSVSARADQGFQVTGQGRLASAADGVWTFSNAALTDFGRIQFGGTTSAFPALKRSTTGLQFRLADDSAYTFADALEYRASGTKVVGAQGAAVADASGGAVIDAEARTALNALLARLRTHGLIAT